MKRTLFLLLCLLSMGLFAAEQKAPKYIFYFIGDGMGINDVQIGSDALRQAKDCERKELNLMKFPVMGALKTYCANSFVTDSSAAGTALATGYKANYGAAGITPDGKAVDSVAVYAKKHGMKVGIVATVTLLEATPGAFFAHQESRGRYYPNTFDLIDSGFDYFAGGNLWDRDGKDMKITPANVQAATNIFARGFEKMDLGNGDMPSIQWKNSEKLIQEAGYKYVSTLEEFQALTKDCGKVYVSHPSREWGISHRVENKEAPFLKDFVEKGIEVLDNDKGFFMMVEGSFIDHGNHSNDGTVMFYELLDFDDAVGSALAFYEKHPEETLIVVTADHDTGALTCGHEGHHPERLLYATAEFGTFSRKFEKYQDKVEECKENHSRELEGKFDEVKPILKECFGVGDKYDLHKDQWEKLEMAFQDSMDPDYDKDSAKAKALYEGNKKPFPYMVKKIFNNMYGIAYHTGGHSSAPVPVFAIGCGAEKFGGFKENTSVPISMAKLIDPQGEFPVKPYEKAMIHY